MKIIYLGNRLSKHGYTPTGVEYLGKVLEEGGFDMVFASEKRNVVFRLIDMLKTIFLNRSADMVLIDTYSSRAFYFACLCGYLSYLLKIPFILILRGGDLPSRTKKTPKIAKRIFVMATHVVAVSNYLKSRLDKFHKTLYIPNTIDLALYKFKRREFVRPRLLWVRSLHQVYNPGLAIQVVKILDNYYPDVTLAMVGPDKDGSKAILESMIMKEGLTSRVVLTGKLSKKDWINLSATYDIFINTTNIDNMPISVTEGMALGLPVVSTNVGGMPFLITDQENGLLVPPNDPQMFAASIRRLIDEPYLAVKLAAHARSTAELFDNKIVLSQWKNLIYASVQQDS